MINNTFYFLTLLESYSYTSESTPVPSAVRLGKHYLCFLVGWLVLDVVCLFVLIKKKKMVLNIIIC